MLFYTIATFDPLFTYPHLWDECATWMVLITLYNGGRKHDYHPTLLIWAPSVLKLQKGD